MYQSSTKSASQSSTGSSTGIPISSFFKVSSLVSAAPLNYILLQNDQHRPGIIQDASRRECFLSDDFYIR
jgi:hypothetical protein